MPSRQQSQNMAKISKFYILTPPHPEWHGMSVKCEEPIYEKQFKFGYCIITLLHFPIAIGQTILLLDAPGGPFRPGA